MRSMIKSLGVTLLEILLVLSIAAMIIVMSIRYYQSASTAQQANMVMEQIQAITAAADNLAIGTGSYSTGVTSTALAAVVGSMNMISPTNGTVTVVPGSPTTYTVTIPVNAAICASVTAKLAANPKMTNITACGTSVVYTYDNTK
jgi:type II secretory pathway pseudopilin PulG